MPRWMAAILASPIASRLARVVLTFMFWSSGFARVVHWRTGLAEMAHFGLRPAWTYSLATIVVQLGGSALVIWGRWAWFGAGVLAVFTLATIPVAHAFWIMRGGERIEQMYSVVNHISTVGGLILAAMICRRELGPAPSPRPR